MEILASTNIRYIYVRISNLLIADLIFHYTCYALLKLTLHVGVFCVDETGFLRPSHIW